MMSKSNYDIYIYNYIKLYIHIISIHPFIHLSIYQSTLVVSWCALICPVVSVKVVPLGSGHVFQWKGWPSGSRRHWSSGIRVAKICKMLIRTSDQTVWPNLWKAPGDLKPGLRESSHVLIGGCHPLLQLDQTGLNLLVLTHTHTILQTHVWNTKKSGNDDSTLRVFHVTIAKNSEVSVQSLCSANLHTDWIHSVSWLSVLGA